MKQVLNDDLIYWLRSIDSNLEKLVYAEQSIANALSGTHFEETGEAELEVKDGFSIVDSLDIIRRDI